MKVGSRSRIAVSSPRVSGADRSAVLADIPDAHLNPSTSINSLTDESIRVNTTVLPSRDAPSPKAAQPTLGSGKFREGRASRPAGESSYRSANAAVQLSTSVIAVGVVSSMSVFTTNRRPSGDTS